ncbi:MAG: type II toxin-antitoxin system HicA family toxin [Bacillota bacterium]
MTRLPRVTGWEVIAALRRMGFRVEYVKGSHYHLVHESDASRQVVVPVHAGMTLKLKTLKSILKQAGVSVDDLKRFL